MEKARGEGIGKEAAEKWYWEQKAERVIDALVRKGYDAKYFTTAEEAEKKIIEDAFSAQTIGLGGSVTIRELKVIDVLKKQGKIIYDHWSEPPEDDPANTRIRIAHLTCDLFLTSANAITLKGEIVNIDGGGNRTNAISFGPKKVLIVAGINKIVKDIEEGVQRIHELAAPLRAKMAGFNTPCAETGFCSPFKPGLHICCITSVLERKPLWTNLSVYLIGKAMGC
jgi:L-lactate utilization protein LutB